MISLWRTANYIFLGNIAPFISDEDKEIASIPNEIYTRKVFIPIVIAIILLAIEFIACSIWAKRKGWKNPVDLDGDSVFVGESFQRWLENNAFEICKPTFYEEYLFYKNYYRGCKFFSKRKLITYFPDSLEELTEQAKRNHLISKLSGIRDK